MEKQFHFRVLNFAYWISFCNHNKAVSRDAVIDCIWEATGNDVYDHTVTVYMKRIRQKIGDDVIKTVKGIGYRIDTEDN